jgi:hypothetical protein
LDVRVFAEFWERGRDEGVRPGLDVRHEAELIAFAFEKGICVGSGREKAFKHGIDERDSFLSTPGFLSGFWFMGTKTHLLLASETLIRGRISSARSFSLT